MDDTIIALAQWLLTAVLIPGGIAMWRQLRQMRVRDAQRAERAQEERDALKRGMQMMLRGDLISIHHQWLAEKGYMPVDVKSSWFAMYEAYEALGTNGVIEGLHRDVVNSHVAPDPERQER